MQRSEIRATIYVMLSLVVATLTGFLRQSMVAYQLGAGRSADIYLISYSIPEFFFIALPILLTPVIIPFFSQIRQRRGEIAAWHWVSRFSIGLILVLVALTAICALAAPTLIEWLSPGFSADERFLAVQTFYRMLPGLSIMGLAVLIGSFLQVYRRFAVPVLTTAVYNLVFIVCLFALPSAVPLEKAGWGVTLGAFVAVLFQVPLLWRLVPPGKIQDHEKVIDRRELGQAFRLTGWMAAGYGVHHLIYFIDRAMATSLGAGSAAILNYGYHLALSIGQLSGLAVSTVIFPDLSDKVSVQDFEGARRSIDHGMALVWGLALPASLGLALFRIPIVKLLLEHGAFLSDSTLAVGTVMAIYAFSVLADSLCQPLWRVIYAQRNGKAVLAVNSVQTLIRVGGNLLLIPFIGYNGIALSALFGLGLQVFILTFLARRTLGWNISLSVMWIFAKICAAAFVTYGIVALFLTWLEVSMKISAPVIILLTGGSIFVLLYAAIIGGAFKFFVKRKDDARG